MTDKIMNIIFAIIEIISRPSRGLGRMGRAEYMTRSYLYTIIFIAIFAFLEKTIFLKYLILIQILCYIILLRINIKRLHDINLKGYWSLFYLISLILSIQYPYIGMLVSIIYHCILSFVPGTKGENKYGEQPLSPSEYKILTAVFLTFVWIIYITTFITLLFMSEGLEVKNILNRGILLKEQLTFDKPIL